MTDIVDKLRKLRTPYEYPSKVHAEAADEIEALRAKIGTLSTSLEEKVNRIEELEKHLSIVSSDHENLDRFLYEEGYRLSQVASHHGIKLRLLGHHITPEQIEKAWKRLYDLKEEQQMQGRWMLEELGIVRDGDGWKIGGEDE